MVLSRCTFLSNLVIKSHSIVIRMGHTKFRATWGKTGNVGVVNLTKAELEEFAASSGFDKGEDITLMYKIAPFSLVSYHQELDEKY